MLAVASQLSVDEVLQRLVHCARELAGARYAALGIPDGEDGFRRFLVIFARGEVIGAFYLTDKEGADTFELGDQELIELLAAHAAIAITNAHLYERIR